jgi:hypothetical protein
MVDLSESMSNDFAGWYDDSHLSDVKVLFQDGSVRNCHKIVLSAASPVWKAAFTGPGDTLDLSGHSTVAAEAVVQFCYTRKQLLTNALLMGIHKLAFRFQLELLQAECEKMIVEDLSVDNCLGLFLYLRKHSFPTLPTALDEAGAMLG